MRATDIFKQIIFSLLNSIGDLPGASQLITTVRGKSIIKDKILLLSDKIWKNKNILHFWLWFLEKSNNQIRPKG